MENIFKPYDKEFLRMAMLKHEETFRQQVHELHRLYQIQKILMMNSDSKRYSIAPNSSMQLDMKRAAADDQEFAQESTTGDDGYCREIIDESEIELTLGPSTYKRSEKKKPETPLTSDSGGPSSFSSSSTGSTRTRTSLNHHQKMNMKRSQGAPGGFKLGIVNFPDMRMGSFQTENETSSSNVDKQLIRQEILNQPPWVLPVLSLNMT